MYSLIYSIKPVASSCIHAFIKSWASVYHFFPNSSGFTLPIRYSLHANFHAAYFAISFSML